VHIICHKHSLDTHRIGVKTGGREKKREGVEEGSFVGLEYGVIYIYIIIYAVSNIFQYVLYERFSAITSRHHLSREKD